MTTVMAPGRMLTHDELVGMVGGDVEVPETSLVRRLVSKVRPVTTTISDTAVATGHVIVEGAKTAGSHVQAFFDRHPLIKEAMAISVTFVMSFTVTLVLLTGVLVLYILTLNWMGDLIS